MFQVPQKSVQKLRKTETIFHNVKTLVGRVEINEEAYLMLGTRRTEFIYPQIYILGLPITCKSESVNAAHPVAFHEKKSEE